MGERAEREEKSTLAYRRAFRGTVDQAVDRLGAELRGRGLGVLATVRLHDILAEKLGERIDPLVILEVCSPLHAHRSLAASREASLLLPCKIVVAKEGPTTYLAVQRPTTVVEALLPLRPLEEVGLEVERLLCEAVDATAGAP